jgi:hypothetical protein
MAIDLIGQSIYWGNEHLKMNTYRNTHTHRHMSWRDTERKRKSGRCKGKSEVRWERTGASVF